MGRVNKASRAAALRAIIRGQELELKQDEERWDKIVEKIRSNPNQMNIRGVWQADQLTSLQTLRVMVLQRERILVELRYELRALQRRRRA